MKKLKTIIENILLTFLVFGILLIPSGAMMAIWADSLLGGKIFASGFIFVSATGVLLAILVD